MVGTAIRRMVGTSAWRQVWLGPGLVFDLPVRFRVLGVPEQHEIPVHTGSWSIAKLQVGLYHESAGSVVVLVRAAARERAGAGRNVPMPDKGRTQRHCQERGDQGAVQSHRV